MFLDSPHREKADQKASLNRLLPELAQGLRGPKRREMIGAAERGVGYAAFHWRNDTLGSYKTQSGHWITRYSVMSKAR